MCLKAFGTIDCGLDIPVDVMHIVGISRRLCNGIRNNSSNVLTNSIDGDGDGWEARKGMKT